MKNGDMPAMPLNQEARVEYGIGGRNMPDGLTKREYFAGLAMQGLLAGPHAEADCGIEGLVYDAVLAADKLLGALERDYD